MRNEPNKPVRVVMRCALLCLGSRAEAFSHSPCLSSFLSLSLPHFLCLFLFAFCPCLSPDRSRRLSYPSDAGKDRGGRRRERERERLENDRPSGQRALGATSRYYLKGTVYLYIYDI